ncbi:MAG: hypothetical protein ABIF17_04750 [Patescibacteria group bacterium]
MNKNIQQICQKINSADILNKKFYPVWFFTNEKIGCFLPKIKEIKGIKKVFSIGGGGDFAFSLLSVSNFDQIDEINVCDIRQMASLTIDFKLAFLKNLEYEVLLDLFLGKRFFDKNNIYDRVVNNMSPIGKEAFCDIMKGYRETHFLKYLKKTGFWYNDSFWQIKHRERYLPYLISKQNYQLLQKNVDKITIYCGDFNKNIGLFKDSYYDLVYISNILDSKKYCRDHDLYLKTVKSKLNNKGLLITLTQDSPQKIIKLLENNGFLLYDTKENRFNIISACFGYYSYSFLLFQNL